MSTKPIASRGLSLKISVFPSDETSTISAAVSVSVSQLASMIAQTGNVAMRTKFCASFS